MTRYEPPLRDFDFLLHDVLHISAGDTPGHAEMDRETTGAILSEAGRICRDTLAPLNAVGDREGCRLERGRVRTPPGFSAAFDDWAAGGWMALDLNPDHGGQGLPHVLYSAVGEMQVAANMALNIYFGLTHGAWNTIHAHGTPAQKALFLPPMAACRWTGTMNLTEPHCGTDLGLLRTRAEPDGAGGWRITGQKIFISAGDHDLAENIVHLVLARLPDAPEGVRGISLFIVPKVLVNDDASLGAANAVSVGKIEHKMGIHGNATCVMNYDGAAGQLLGQPHQGLRQMFTMMNEARLGVALQGLGQAAIALTNAADYARTRLQGRAAGGAQNPGGPADPLIVHPDVRRMLMDQRAFVEGARMLALWTASLIDGARHLGDAGAEGLVSLLTPVLKGFFTDKGFEACVQAQQIFGGHGYIEETGMSQFVRDARIAMIYEGANGVQALDLVGRKLGADGGRQVMALLALIKDEIAATPDTLDADFARPLAAALDDLQSALDWFISHGTADAKSALAGSTDLLHLMGHVLMGLAWLRMARAAQRLGPDHRLASAKLVTGRHYMARHLPETALRLARIRAGGATVMTLPAEIF